MTTAVRTPNRVWLVLPDPFSTRIFAGCGVVDGLRSELGGRLRAVVLMDTTQADEWETHLEGLDVFRREELIPARVGVGERVTRSIDYRLDRQIGFHPQAIRFNLRHGFHRERMRPGHPNLMLDATRRGWLPRWRPLEAAMREWLYAGHRYTPHALLEQMKAECGAVVFSNVQTHPAVPFLIAGRRLGVPLDRKSVV